MVLLGILREVYHLPLRQTIGLAQSILDLMQVVLPLPDFSTLSRRLQTVCIPLSTTRQPRSGNLVVLIDSTGVKVAGEGSWKIRMHGKSHATKWRKLHIATSESGGEILSLTVTDAPQSDWSQVPELLTAIPGTIARVIADGAYDVRPCRKVILERGATALIPPNKRGKIHLEDSILRERNTMLQTIRRTSRQHWKQSSGYHRRSRIEATMFRYKAAFSDRLSTRTDISQESQLSLRTHILNRWLQLGMPAYGGQPS
jgi:IS5 family transposase